MRNSLLKNSAAVAILALAAYPSAVGTPAFASVHRNRATVARPSAAPGQIVVRVPAGYTDADTAQLAAGASCAVTQSIPYSPRFYVFTLLSQATTTRAAAATQAPPAGASADVLAAVATLIKTPGVLAKPNYYRYPEQVGAVVAPITPLVPNAPTGPALDLESNDPLYYPNTVSSAGQQWNLQMIRMPQAWAIQSNVVGRTVIVGVIDTGIDPTHPDLINRIAPGGQDFSPLLNTPPGTVLTTLDDEVGHGTHVSGIIAAEIQNSIGVASVAGWNRNGVDIKVLPIRVFGATGGVTAAVEIAGINFAVTQKVDVINMSLGGLSLLADLTTDPEYAALLNATNSGITVVAAAGNDGLELGSKIGIYDYPAGFPNVISVSAVGPTRTLSTYSDFGYNIAISAPGGDDPTFSDPSKMVLSTYSRNPTAVAAQASSGYPITPLIGYAIDQGTSMASPHVAAAAALLIAAGAPRDPVMIKSILQANAQVLDETPNNTGGNKYGAGLLDVYHALASLTTTLKPRFTAQLSEVVDNAVAVPIPATNSASSGSSGYSLVASEPYTDRGLSYVRPQAPFLIRYVGRAQLTDAVGVDHPEYVTLDISPATTPTSIIRHYVGGAVKSTTTFPLPGLPANANPATVTEIAAPTNDALNLPDGSYRATLKVFNPDPAVNAYQEQGIVFFEVASHVIGQGRSMFSSPFTVKPSVVGSLPPEIFEFGTSTNFKLARYNAQRLPTDLDYALYSPLPNAVQNPQAQFATPRALNGSPITYFVTDPSTSIAPVGLGYWLDVDRQVSLNPTGDVVTQAVAIKLFASGGGWNMIGSPFTYSVLWPSASVLTTNGQSYSLQDAVTQGIVSPALVGYSGGQYVYSVAPSGTLDPFQGYWVRAYQDCTLIIPPSAGRSRASHLANTGHLSELPAIDGWRARLSATVAGDRDGENYFGVVRSADTQRSYDLPKPPSGAGHAYVRFVKPDANGKSEWYALDMRRSAQPSAQFTWNADISTDKSDADVTVSWDGLGNAPRSADLFLTDTVTGRRVSMRSRSSYTFRAAEAGSTRHMIITLEKGQSGGPLSMTNFRVIPSGRAVHSTAFRFMANRSADVTAVVRALNGRTVANIGGGTRAEAALDTVLHWNGHNADGTPVPAGLYFIEVTLTTPDGQTTTVKQPFTSLY